jgi:hypothetical protein
MLTERRPKLSSADKQRRAIVVAETMHQDGELPLERTRLAGRGTDWLVLANAKVYSGAGSRHCYEIISVSYGFALVERQEN